MTNASKSQKTVKIQEQEMKGVSTMTTEKLNLQQKPDYSVTNFVKAQLLQMAAAGKDQLRLPKANTDTLDMLMNLGAIEGYEVRNNATMIDKETGKRYVEIKIIGIDIQATATSKAGKRYFVFFTGQ